MKQLLYHPDTLPKGFILNGVNCGLKENLCDLSVFYSVKNSNAAAMFTKNKLKSASIILSQRNIKNKIKSIIVNSKFANTACGEKGMKLAEEITRFFARKLNIKPHQILLASTGVIGKLPDLNKIRNGLDMLAEKVRKGKIDIKSAVQGIMTTDKKYKISYRKFKLSGKVITIWGCSKGVGMIYPNLATLLCILLTDLNISKKLLKEALKNAVENSFNRITVDGETSPNDSVFILANGMMNNKMIKKVDSDYLIFLKNLNDVCTELAQKNVLDAEGATKFINIIVKNALSINVAKDVSKAVANSLLTKTAIYGENTNFGRILSACGNTKSKFDINKVDIYINGLKVVENSVMRDVKGNPFKDKKIEIILDLKQGKSRYNYFTSDISLDYVKLNSAYIT